MAEIKIRHPKSQTQNQVITSDTLFAGKLACCQYANGYRFSVDAVLLAVLLEAQLRYGAKGPGRDAHADVAGLFGDPDALPLQVGQLAALGLVMRMGNIVGRLRPFSRDLAASRHDRYLVTFLLCTARDDE